MFKILLIIGCFLVVGHIEYQDIQVHEAAHTCRYQDETTTPTYAQCMANQFENNNDK